MIASSAAVRLYADYALKYIRVGSIENFLFRRDLDSLIVWADRNRMKLNVKKFHSVSFGKHENSQTDTHRLDGFALETKNSFKYLGVPITNNFNWGIHIATIISKANRTLGKVKRSLFGEELDQSRNFMGRFKIGF